MADHDRLLRLYLVGSGDREDTGVYVLDEDGEPLGRLSGVTTVNLGIRPSDPVAHPRLTLEIAKPGFDFDLHYPVHGRPEDRLSRTQVQEVFCPRCGAGPGASCIGARGKARESNHRERVQLAEEQARG